MYAEKICKTSCINPDLDYKKYGRMSTGEDTLQSVEFFDECRYFVYLNEALYDKVCFVGFQIEKFKKMYLEYRFYDVGKFSTELCKRDVGKLEAIRYICRKKGVSISSVMAFGDNGNDVDLLASCGYGVAMKNGSAQAKKAAKYIKRLCE